jgi:hypothetical protein
MEIGWIYYGFSGAIANFVVWISLFFPVFHPLVGYKNYLPVRGTGQRLHMSG